MIIPVVNVAMIPGNRNRDNIVFFVQLTISGCSIICGKCLFIAIPCRHLHYSFLRGRSIIPTCHENIRGTSTKKLQAEHYFKK